MKVKLGELTKIRTGKLDANAASENGKYPFFTCSKEPLRISTYSYDCECVLVAGNGDLNVKYYNGKFDAYQRTYIIESNSNGRLHLPYLYYFMTRYIQELRKLSIGGVIKYIKLGNLTDAEISLPSIKEQKDACEKLKKVKDIIDKKEAQISYLDNLIKARFVEMFGGIDLAPQNKEWTKISDIGEVVSGSTPKTSIKEYWNGNICWITPAELSNMSGIIYDSKKKITERGKSSCSLRMMPSRTVILSSRAPIGKVALLGKEMCCNQGFKNIICNEKVVPEYLYYLLGYNTIFLNSLGRGATFKEISKKIVGEIKVPLPAKELQNQFAVFTRQVDKSKFAVQKSLEKTQLLFDSLMQEYFG
jgi:restriction modification system, type I